MTLRCSRTSYCGQGATRGRASVWSPFRCQIFEGTPGIPFHSDIQSATKQSIQICTTNGGPSSPE